MLNDYSAWFKSKTQSFPKKYKYDQDPLDPKKYPLKVFLKVVQRHKDLAKQDRTYIWGIFEKTSGKLFGALDIHVICRDQICKANLGYQVFNNFWRKGYAEESLKTFIK